MNQKRKNAFTLIELLAVIVILAIIALIAVPVIMNIINKANKSAFKDTAYGIISAGELYFAEQQLEPMGMQDDVTIQLPDTTKTLELKGEVPAGSITITKEGKIALAVQNGKYCITKGLDDTDIAVTENYKTCKSPIENVVVTLPAVGTSAEDCTWEQISAIGNANKADEYFNLGDTKAITLTTGEEIIMEIVAFNTDEKTDGSKAAITWISKDLIAQHKINTETYTKNAWDASVMRSWIQSEVYNTLPSELQGVIITVNKTYSYNNLGFNPTVSETRISEDNLWIPSHYEIFGTTKDHPDDEGQTESYGATYINYFSDDASRIKTYNDVASNWWLRSFIGQSNYGDYFCLVSNNGIHTFTTSTSSLGVALGFCT